MVLFFSFFSEIIFWLKYLCFLDTPICVFFSNLGQFLEIYIFFDPILQQEENKNIWTSDIPPISQEPHECGKHSGVLIFLIQKKLKMASGSLFSQKVLFYPFLTQYYKGKERKKSGLQIYHPYQKNLTSVASYMGYRSI